MKKYTPYLVIVLLLGILLFQCKQNDIAKKKLEVAEHNINALQDTIRITKTKNDKPEYDKLSFLVDKVENLEKLNKDLAKEVKITNGKVASIIKGSVSIETVPYPVIVKAEIKDSTVTASFSKDTVYSPGNFRKIKGFTQYNLRDGKTNGTILEDKFGMTFTTGIKNLDKGKPEIFLRSDYPGFFVDSLNGAVLDPFIFSRKTKQKLITLGLQIGYTPITYSLINKKINFDPLRFGAGLGININLSRLFSKE